MAKLFIVLMLLTGIGCASSAHKVVNTGERMLYAVTVESDGKKFGHGYLAAGAVKGYHGPMRIRQSPPPVISWRTVEYGNTISKVAGLNRKPRGGQEVVFEIDGQNVTVRFEQ